MSFFDDDAHDEGFDHNDEPAPGTGAAWAAAVFMATNLVLCLCGGLVFAMTVNALPTGVDHVTFRQATAAALLLRMAAIVARA
jgi:hypothetical protein